MSGGILRFPWTSQPQTLVGIDPNWGGPALKMLLVQSGGGVRDIVNPSIVWTPNNNAKTKATPKGIAASFDGVDDYFSASGYEGITGAKGTFFMWAPRIGALDSNGTVWFGTNTGTATYFQSTATSALCFGVTVNSVPSVANTSNTSLVFTANTTSASQKYYRNGLEEGTPAAFSPAAFAAGSKNFNFGRYIGGINWDADADIVIAGFTTEVWTAARAKAFHDNPWQLFAPIQRTIWVPAAAGGAYTLAADSGSFALTGQDAGLAFNRTLAAASGSFALTGQDAGLAFNRVLSAENGSYALDGQDVTLTYTPISGATYTLVAASGSFALTGQDTGLAFNRVLTADTQSYSLSGDVAGLAFNRVLTADTVSYALTGQDVTLTYTSNGFTYTLTAESGSFEVTGQDASLRHTTTAIAGGGGWLPQTRRKSRKQIYEERVKLGILPPPVIKAAAKVAAVAQTVEEFKEERPKYEEMFLKAIKKTEWLPDYTRAIQAQLAIMEQEEEELLLLL